MKKTLSVLLSVLLLSLVTVPSFAAPATLNKENPVGSVKIFTGEGKQDEYELTEQSRNHAERELTIPADTEIPWEATSYAIGKVTATKMWLSPGKTVKVAVTSLNGSKLVNTLDSSKTIAYTLTGAEQMAFLPGDYMKSYDLSVNIAEAEWQKAASGEHTDVLTFTAEYTNA